MSKHPSAVSDELRDPAPEREAPSGPFVAEVEPLVARALRERRSAAHPRGGRNR